MATRTSTRRPRESGGAGRARKSRQYLVDERGRPTAIVLPLGEYEELVEAAEQRDDIRHLEEAKKVRGKPISLEELEARLRVRGKLR